MTSPHQSDFVFLRRALALARRSFGLASPNPHVGAVVVDSEGAVVGEGFHSYAEIKHAEILAVEQAGEKTNGATLYINLSLVPIRAAPARVPTP